MLWHDEGRSSPACLTPLCTKRGSIYLHDTTSLETSSGGLCSMKPEQSKGWGMRVPFCTLHPPPQNLSLSPLCRLYVSVSNLLPSSNRHTRQRWVLPAVSSLHACLLHVPHFLRSSLDYDPLGSIVNAWQRLLHPLRLVPDNLIKVLSCFNPTQTQVANVTSGRLRQPSDCCLVRSDGVTRVAILCRSCQSSAPPF